MRSSEELEGHRALVWYRYGLRDIALATLCTVAYMFLVFGSLASI
jgi:hypothetical protein